MPAPRGGFEDGGRPWVFAAKPDRFPKRGPRGYPGRTAIGQWADTHRWQCGGGGLADFKVAVGFELARIVDRFGDHF